MRFRRESGEQKVRITRESDDNQVVVVGVMVVVVVAADVGVVGVVGC